MLKGVEQSSVSIYDEISECLLRDSDCLDCLPPDWDLKKLGDVLKLEYGKPLEKDRRKDDGIYPAYGANGVKCRTDECYWDKPSIIIGRKGSAGEVNLAEDAFWPLDVTYFVIFDENEYDLLFIYYCLKNLRLQTLAKGVKPGINRNDVYEIECPFPKLPEQKRIVKYVGILQAKIDELRVLNQERLEGLSEFNQSVLQNAFSGGISASSTRDRKA
ncbi:MAG: restriction endonuclease subunit S [Proteobacteria bacterium]|nr:restriction endonuclease subunit S [Pseudomonadota bacterium]